MAKEKKKIEVKNLRVRNRVACLVHSYTFLLQLNQASPRNKERQEFFFDVSFPSLNDQSQNI